MSTLTQITSSEYANLNSEITAMLSTNRKPAICIYSDAEGTVPVNDAAGNPIVNLEITSVSITQSYIDSVTNQPVSASVTIYFADHSFKVIDNKDTYYYKITGVDFPLRTI